MSYQFDALLTSDQPISTLRDPASFRRRVDRLTNSDAPRFSRLWNYYRNPLLASVNRSNDLGSARPYRQAQEWGLPSRITGFAPGAASIDITLDGIARKEVVVENDIAWRIETLVDHLFGKSITLTSAANDAPRRRAIETLLRLIFQHNGGITFCQQLALLGSVYGFVDVLVKFDPSRMNDANLSESAGASARTDDSSANSPAGPAPREGERSEGGATHAALERIARCIRFEIVEPARALPLLSDSDYRDVQAYAQVYTAPRPVKSKTPAARSAIKRGWLDRIWPRFSNDASSDEMHVVDLLTPTHWQRYEDETLVASGANSLGELPLVHIQNSAVPFEYGGASDVEALVPLQDELNTRLSDRAHRITMQSFKMYLGKGIDNFGELPVAPGRMWMTDNENAEVIEFGGDQSSPGEDSHIREIREALDKTSSVTPIAAGAIRGRIGRLTSAAALRVTLLALLAKTERRRTLYGDGIKRMGALALAWLDRAGLFPTQSNERAIELSWPSPLPIDDSEKLDDAEAKLRIGVPREIVLRELGYASPEALPSPEFDSEAHIPFRKED